MSPPNILYSSLLMVAGAICLIVAVIIFQTRRTMTGAPTLMTLLCSLAWWDITYAIFWADTPAPTNYFWLDITYIGVVIVPAALFVFSLQLSHLSGWLKTPLVTVLYLEPLIVLAILFTDSQHGLFFAGKRTENSAFILDAGPVFWFNVVFSYTLILLSTLLLVRAFIRFTGVYRKQIGVVLVGMSVTWINSIIFVAGINPLPGADNTPFSFTLAAVAFAYSLMRFRLLDVVPVARDILIEKMSDGVLVIDDQNRIVDTNITARHMLDISNEALGVSVDQVFAHWKPADREALIVGISNLDIKLAGKPITHVESQSTPIMDRKNRRIGRLILLHDITKLKSIQNELHFFANRDSLTGAVNRRHFMELAKRELTRSKRYGRSMSLVLMDLDNFKKVNDTYGHQSGDQALLTLKRICTQGTRTVDIFARLGGEEFALLLPETDQDAAAVIADRIRAQLHNTTIKNGTHKIRITTSMGVTEFDSQKDDTLDAMLSRADKALYQAKSAGRNRVLIWQAEMK